MKRTDAVTLLLAVVLLTIDADGQQGMVHKPWMFIVGSIIPPRGPSRSAEFSKACFEKLKSYFDTTSYQVILLRPGQTVDGISNRKKDIILTSDMNDYFTRGTEYDTLVLWMEYHVGFIHERISVPYRRGYGSDMPDRVARRVFETAFTEFLGSISLQAGPPGATMVIDEDITLTPPCEFLLPPGRYGLQTSFPDFLSRVDSVDVLPARMTKKRVLLLPQD